MLPLREFQEQFRKALFSDHPDSSLQHLIVSNGLGVNRRIQVYRNNMFASLTDSLRATYPAIASLVGDAFFSMLCDRYVRAHPSTNGDLHQFGNRFAAFLATQSELASLPYAEDTARLEWAYHRLFHASEKELLQPQQLAVIDEKNYQHLCFQLHPASFLMTSRYPLVAIWKLAIHGDENSPAVDLDQGGIRLMVARRDLVMEFQFLDEAEYDFLLAIQAGSSLEQIVDTVGAKHATFDLQTCLSNQFKKRNLVGFHLQQRDYAFR